MLRLLNILSRFNLQYNSLICLNISVSSLLLLLNIYHRYLIESVYEIDKEFIEFLAPVMNSDVEIDARCDLLSSLREKNYGRRSVKCLQSLAHVNCSTDDFHIHMPMTSTSLTTQSGTSILINN